MAKHHGEVAGFIITQVGTGQPLRQYRAATGERVLFTIPTNVAVPLFTSRADAQSAIHESVQYWAKVARNATRTEEEYLAQLKRDPDCWPKNYRVRMVRYAK